MGAPVGKPGSGRCNSADESRHRRAPPPDGDSGTDTRCAPHRGPLPRRGQPLPGRAHHRRQSRRTTGRSILSAPRRPRCDPRRDRGVPHRASVPCMRRIAPWRPCSSPTSFHRPSAPPRSATTRGRGSWTITTRWSLERSTVIVAARSIRRVTASSRPSTDPRAPCDARKRSARACGRWASKCGRDFTPVRSSSAVTTSAGSPSTSASACRR